MTSTKATYLLQQENKTNNGRLSLAVPHLNFSNTLKFIKKKKAHAGIAYSTCTILPLWYFFALNEKQTQISNNLMGFETIEINLVTFTCLICASFFPCSSALPAPSTELQSLRWWHLSPKYGKKLNWVKSYYGRRLDIFRRTDGLFKHFCFVVVKFFI